MMSLFSRLFGGNSRRDDAGDAEGLHVYVRCDKCGEKIHIRANRRTDVTVEYADGGEQGTRMLHKEILGSRCQNLMYVHVTLGAGDRIAESTTERCTIVSQAEYDAPA